MTIFRDIDALDDITQAWWDLWRRDTRATPFQSPAWLIPWHRAFAPGPLHVVALWHDERLAALAPLYIETQTRRLLPIGISLSDNLDILAEDASAAQALVTHVLEEAPCPRVEIENLPSQAHARGLSEIEGWTCREAQNEVCPFLALGPSWDGHVPARKRRQWRRAVREAQAHGDTRIEAITDRADGFLDHLARLHRARWEARAEAGLLADEAVQKFHQLAAPALLRAGLARFYLLGFAGKVTGAYYGLAAKGRAYAYIGGFDPAFSHESPGTILIAHAIAQAHEEGDKRFEFLRGGEDYKYAWGAQDEPVYRRIWERNA
ncbi:MAG: glycosyl transferase, group 1 [Hyphomicrobiales bacterium]|nr:glycosyl transferase, group 1 [Hyphomicrobiales bacterium]